MQKLLSLSVMDIPLKRSSMANLFVESCSQISQGHSICHWLILLEGKDMENHPLTCLNLWLAWAHLFRVSFEHFNFFEKKNTKWSNSVLFYILTYLSGKGLLQSQRLLLQMLIMAANQKSKDSKNSKTPGMVLLDYLLLIWFLSPLILPHLRSKVPFQCLY